MKFKIALEAAKELETINEIASRYGVHPSQVKSWKKQLLEEGDAIFVAAPGAEDKVFRYAIVAEVMHDADPPYVTLISSHDGPLTKLYKEEWCDKIRLIKKEKKDLPWPL